MAEDKVESRDSWRTLLPFTELFRAFQIALDLNKLFLAAAGIVVMSLGWWFLSTLYYTGQDRAPKNGAQAGLDPEKDYGRFRDERLRWNLMHEAIGLSGTAELPRYEIEDIAQNYSEYAHAAKAFPDGKNPDPAK